jgi:hypothetical protein
MMPSPREASRDSVSARGVADHALLAPGARDGDAATVEDGCHAPGAGVGLGQPGDGAQGGGDAVARQAQPDAASHHVGAVVVAGRPGEDRHADRDAQRAGQGRPEQVGHLGAALGHHAQCHARGSDAASAFAGGPQRAQRDRAVGGDERDRRAAERRRGGAHLLLERPEVGARQCPGGGEHVEHRRRAVEVPLDRQGDRARTVEQGLLGAGPDALMRAPGHPGRKPDQGQGHRRDEQEQAPRQRGRPAPCLAGRLRAGDVVTDDAGRGEAGRR